VGGRASASPTVCSAGLATLRGGGHEGRAPVHDAAKALYTWSAGVRTAPRAVLTPTFDRVALRPDAGTVWDDVCFFGEDVAVAWMRERLGERDAVRLGGVLAVDVLSQHFAVEVKAGLATNGEKAQQWRLTFSKARGAERDRLLRMTVEGRRRYREKKQQRIMLRKEALLRDLVALTKRAIAPATLTLIVDPVRRHVDVFWFAGWHNRIGWQSAEAARAFQGSFLVEWRGRDDSP
jgi:hypothetical protein